jgi:hypothetical protein
VRIQNLGTTWVYFEEFYLLVNFKKDIFYASEMYMSILLMERLGNSRLYLREDTYRIGIIAFDVSTFRCTATEELDPPSLGYMKDLREVFFVQNRRNFLADTDQQDCGRPLFCTRSKERDETFSKLHPEETAAIDEILTIPKIAEIYKNIKTSFVIFRPSVKSPCQRVST